MNGEKCRYQYQLKSSNGEQVAGCSFNGSLCDFTADIKRCPIVSRNIRICADLLTILTPREVTEIQLRKGVITDGGRR